MFAHTMVIHNETFSRVGVSEDIVTPLWWGVFSGVLAACISFACLCACCSVYRYNRAVHHTYEGLPLIKVKYTSR